MGLFFLLRDYESFGWWGFGLLVIQVVHESEALIFGTTKLRIA